MEEETYEQEPVEQAGMQESTELEGEEENQTLETSEAEAETTEEEAPQPEGEMESEGEAGESETESKPEEEVVSDWTQSKFKKAIAKKTKQKYEMQERYNTEIQGLKAEIESLKNPKQPEKELTLLDFENDQGKYQQYLANQAAKNIHAEQQKVAEENNQKIQQVQNIQRDFSKKVEAVKDHLPSDYVEVIQSGNARNLNVETQEDILDSEVAPQLAYFFNKNPEDVDRINRMRPRKRYDFLNKLEAEIKENLAKKSKKPTTQAPRPAARPKQAGKVGAANLKTLASKASSPQFGDKYLEERRRRKNAQR